VGFPLTGWANKARIEGTEELVKAGTSLGNTQFSHSHRRYFHPRPPKKQPPPRQPFAICNVAGTLRVPFVMFFYDTLRADGTRSVPATLMGNLRERLPPKVVQDDSHGLKAYPKTIFVILSKAKNLEGT
jgi:hypothetical protein